MFIPHEHRCPWDPEEAIRSVRARVPSSCETPHRVLGTELDSSSVLCIACLVFVNSFSVCCTKVFFVFIHQFWRIVLQDIIVWVGSNCLAKLELHLPMSSWLLEFLSRNLLLFSLSEFLYSLIMFSVAFSVSIFVAVLFCFVFGLSTHCLNYAIMWGGFSTWMNI